MNTMLTQRTPSFGKRRHYHSETVTDATSEPLVIPSLGREAAVAVMPGTDALVQFTLSGYDAIAAGTATWHDWPSGTVTTTTTDGVVGNVSALRLVSTGASDGEVSV